MIFVSTSLLLLLVIINIIIFWFNHREGGKCFRISVSRTLLFIKSSRLNNISVDVNKKLRKNCKTYIITILKNINNKVVK